MNTVNVEQLTMKELLVEIRRIGKTQDVFMKSINDKYDNLLSVMNQRLVKKIILNQKAF